MSELIDFCKQGNVHGVRAWLRGNPQTNINKITDKNGTTAAMCASVRGHTGVVQVLIQEGGADVNVQNKQGWTACIYASENGHVDTLRLLIESGADVNIESKDGVTALKGAVYWGHLDAALLLIRSGADPIRKSSGTSALDNAQTESMRSAIVYAMYAKQEEDNGSVPQSDFAEVECAEIVNGTRAAVDGETDTSVSVADHALGEIPEEFVSKSPVLKGRDWNTEPQSPSMDDEVNTRLYDLEGQYGELLRLQEKTREVQQVEIAELQSRLDSLPQHVLESESLEKTNYPAEQAGADILRDQMASLEARIESWPDKIRGLEEAFNQQLETIRLEHQQQLSSMEVRNAFIMKQLVAVETQSRAMQQRITELENESKLLDVGTGADYESQLTRELHEVSRRLFNIERKKKKRWFSRT